ncbi:hypothetical protein GCM10017784_20110 [Deinococcus indicus]|nr:hypothetical protein GCM10017784_20110 [Deinococcus indicus]
MLVTERECTGEVSDGFFLLSGRKQEFAQVHVGEGESVRVTQVLSTLTGLVRDVNGTVVLTRQ